LLAFRLGRHVSVVSVSVPECDDKPYKHLHIYRGLDAPFRNKIGLLDYVPFDSPGCLSFSLGYPLERPSKGRSILSGGCPRRDKQRNGTSSCVDGPDVV
jgi:hypothetical protein